MATRRTGAPRKSGPGPIRKKRIGELLIAQGFIESEHVQEALTIQQKEGGKIVEILINLGHLDVQTFAKFLASQPGIPSIDLAQYNVTPDFCKLIPRQYAVKHEVFPIDKMGKLLTVGMACPLDSLTIGELEEITKLRVKALLCDAQAIRNAIEKHYPDSKEAAAKPAPAGSYEKIESLMRLESAAKVVRQIDTLPVLPQTVQRVREAMENPDVSMNEIADVVTLDPPLSAKLLQIANSAAYGFPNRVDNVRMAATLLGLRELGDVVLSSAVVDIMEKSKNFDYERFSRDATFSATAAKAVAAACGKKSEPGVFMAGLLQDIGRFALSETVSARYAKIDQSLTSADLVAAEGEALGIAHPEAGYILACNWELPDGIAQAIRFHHDPDLASEAAHLVAIASVAAFMTDVHSCVTQPSEGLFEACATALSMLNLDTQAALQAYIETVAAMETDPE